MDEREGAQHDPSTRRARAAERVADGFTGVIKDVSDGIDRGLCNLDDDAFAAFLAALERNKPKLTDDEIERIADQVTDAFASRWGKELEPSRASKLRGCVRDVAVGLVTALVAGPAADMITYIWHLGGVHFDAADSDDRPQERLSEVRRNDAIRVRLLQGLPPSTAERLEHDAVAHELMREALERQLSAALDGTDLVAEVTDFHRANDGRPFPLFDFLAFAWEIVAVDMGERLEMDP